MSSLERADNRIISMARWNDSDAFRSPTGIRVNWYNPWCNEKAFLCRSYSFINIYHYPELQLRVEKKLLAVS